MTSFLGYSKSNNNFFGLNDEEICQLYREAENENVGGLGIGYYKLTPTIKEALNPNFLKVELILLMNFYVENLPIEIRIFIFNFEKKIYNFN